MHQPRLFVLAPEALAVTAHYEPGVGWAVTVIVRRQLETFEDCHRETYAALTTPELLEVIDSDLAAALGL